MISVEDEVHCPFKVHASASAHVLQFLAHGRGWGGHM